MLVSIILARLLSPEDYGTIALITVFISILQVFVDSGLGNALIQKIDADDLDFSTVFYFNIILGLLLYAGIFSVAPLIAKFYDNVTLISVIRISSLTIVISGVKNIQQAIISKRLIFKKFFFATVAGTLGSAVLGIIMAYMGFGVWALVTQQIFNSLVDTIILWLTVKWRPIRAFSLVRLKKLFSYGWKLLASNLINAIYNDVRQLIIGKMYSSSDLAYYNKGKQFPDLFVTNINTSIDSVLFPVMSEKQNDKKRVKQMTRRSIMVSSYLMWPCMFGIMAIGKPLIKLLLTDKWLPSLPFLYIFCFVYGMQPVHTANLNAIKALGRTDLYLKMEIIKKTVGIVIILISMNFGVFVIGLGSAVYTIIASVINVFPNRKLLDYSYIEQLKDILPSFVLSAFMLIIIRPLLYLKFNDVFTVLMQIVMGGSFYLFGSILFKMESYRFIRETISKIHENRRLQKN